MLTLLGICLFDGPITINWHDCWETLITSMSEEQGTFCFFKKPASFVVPLKIEAYWIPGLFKSLLLCLLLLFLKLSLRCQRHTCTQPERGVVTHTLRLSEAGSHTHSDFPRLTILVSYGITDWMIDLSVIWTMAYVCFVASKSKECCNIAS